MRSIFVVLGIAISTGLATPPVLAQSTNGPDRDVVMSSAGGISKGSYQGGVDWTITEFLRRQRLQPFRDKLRQMLVTSQSPVVDTPRYQLRATTGASAGNINAVFAAVGWCIDSIGEAREIQAEDSLFWKTWVNTGIADLLPEARNGEAAALSRAFVRQQHKATLLRVLTDATPTADCDVRVGITLTKLRPEKATIDESVGEIGVQRFAAVFNVVRHGDNMPATSTDVIGGAVSEVQRIGPWIDFQWNTDAPKRASYGALVLPYRLRDQSRGRRQERIDDVFTTMTASSAFPVAFAPVQLCYESGGLIASQQKEPVRCDLFSDGGVFDNNPIGLAVRLLETKRERVLQDVLATLILEPSGLLETKRERVLQGRHQLLQPIDVAYSSPGNFREPLSLARRTVSQESERTGVGAALQLFTGAIASARDYELQSVRRQNARDKELSTVVDRTTAEPVLRISSRRAPIVGESLYSFGAFLGRPFREYDFYTGVYDGLEFVARHFVCGQAKTPLPPGEMSTCVSKVHERLIEENVLTLPSVGEEVVRWHRDDEYAPPLAGRIARGDECGSRSGLGERDSARLAIMCVVHKALRERMSDAQTCQKNGAGMVDRLLCPGGLSHVLEALSSEQKRRPDDAPATTVAEGIAFLLKECVDEANIAAASRPRRASRLSQGECHVDQSFSDLVARPQREVYSLMRRALRNIEAGEIANRAEGSPSVDFLTKVAFSIFRTSTMRYRDGNWGPFEFNRSSSALGGGSLRAVLATGVGLLAPNYVHNVIVNEQRDQSALGWQPLSLILSPKLYVNSQAELFLPGLSFDTLWSPRVREHVGWGVSVGTFAVPRRTLLPSSIDLGFFRLPRSYGREGMTASRNTLRLSSRHVADKLMVTAFMWSDRFQVSLGVSDLNGIAYWLLR